MIAIRKATPAFADFNDRELLDVENPHLFAFLRSRPDRRHESILVVGNFDDKPQYLDTASVSKRGGPSQYGSLTDLYSGESPGQLHARIVIPPRRFYWLSG
jgi:amylosucrase